MFKVRANSLEEYFGADLARKSDLLALDVLSRKTAPGLERWFYPGAPDGGPGMQKNVGFVTFQQLDQAAVSALLKDTDKTLRQNPIGALQYGTYRIVSSSVAGQPASPPRASRGTIAS
jgi:hypothetical protein